MKKGKGQITKTQRDSISAIRAIQRVAKAVGVRLTQSCLDDLEQQLVTEDKAGNDGSSSFIFTEADVESMAPRVKFLDVDDIAQGETLRKQARDDAVEKGCARPWESGEGELQVGDCCGILCDKKDAAKLAADKEAADDLHERHMSVVGRGIKVHWPGDKDEHFDGIVERYDSVTGMHRVAYDAPDAPEGEERDQAAGEGRQ